MECPTRRFEAPIYAVFRIVAGAMFLQHGLQKLFGVLGKPAETVGTQMWIGGVIELVCGSAIFLGFLTSWAGFLASGMMAVAYFQVHQPKGTLPIQNGGELAVLYCFAFLLISAKGDGIFSVGGRRKGS